MHATSRLKAAGIPFAHTHDGGSRHIVIRHAGRTIDFWPESGQWYDRANKKPRVGVRGLIKEFEKCSSRIKGKAAKPEALPSIKAT